MLAGDSQVTSDARLQVSQTESKLLLKPRTNRGSLRKVDCASKQITQHRQTGPKLDSFGQAFVVEKIIARWTDKQIVAGIRAAKHLPSDGTLSKEALWRYRRMDVCKVDVELLTDEARRVGHTALSEAIVTAVEIIRTISDELITDDFKLSQASSQRLRVMFSGLHSSQKLIFDIFGPDLPQMLATEFATATGPAQSLMETHALQLRQLVCLELKQKLDSLQANRLEND